MSKRWRRRGVARALVAHCFELIQPPAELSLITFGADNASGQPARDFYACMGFHVAEAAANGPESGTRQVYRCQFL